MVKHFKLLFCLIPFLVVALCPLVHAGAIYYDPSNGFCFTLPTYSTAIGFSSSQIFNSASRIGDYWYFDLSELSVQNANLTVNTLFSGNVFGGTLSGYVGVLAIVTVLNTGIVVSPGTVSAGGVTLLNVGSLLAFNSASTGCFFYDSGSLRTYVKAVLGSGSTVLNVDFNGSVTPPLGGGDGVTITVPDVSLNVGSGQTVHADFVVSWNSFVSQVTLSTVSFAGSETSWVSGSSIPILLTPTSNTFSFTVSVPGSVENGTYVIPCTMLFTHSQGSSTVHANVVVTVGAVGWGGLEFLGPFAALVGPALAWVVEYELLLSFSAFALTVVSVAAYVKRRR